MTRLLATALVALAFPLAAAEPAPEHPEKPMLWKVEGKDLAEPSWLFGTIHIGQGPIATLHPAAERALESSDALYTEVPMDMATQLGLATAFIRKDGKTLTESIGAELATQLDTELRAISPVLSSKGLNSFKTWAVAVTVPMLKLQLQGGEALDSIVWKKASKAGLKTGALEKPADQFGIFDGLTEKEQVSLLAETLRLQKEARTQGEDPIDALVDAYVAGDDEQLGAEMEKQFREMAEGEHAELGKKLMKQLLDDRNVDMARTIVRLLGEEPGKSHFFAVGSGHYIGKGNIGELLTREGYTVTRVTE